MVPIEKEVAAPSHGIVVETTTGSIRGALINGVNIFRSIPYAAPPLGKQRFAPPQPVSPWTGTRESTRIGPSAPQPASRLDAVMGVAPFEQSEDCLTVSVWSPSLRGKRLPVLVWFHGGAYITGGGDLPFYDAENLARRGDIVVVTVNSRLGAIGYLYLQQSQNDAYANRGLLDQEYALLWVKRNIDLFGGDPDNITAAGQSAGGGAVMALLTRSSSRALIQRAIVQSPAIATQSVVIAETISRRFFAAAGINYGDADRLSDLPLAALLSAQKQVASEISASGNLEPPFQLVTGTTTLPFPPAKFIASGGVSEMPFIIGTTRDEVHAWLAQDDNMVSLSPMKMFVRLIRTHGVVPALAYCVLSLWHLRLPPWRVVSKLGTYVAFKRPVIELANGHSKNGGAVHVYRFDWQPTVEAKFGACHCIELPFLFGNLDQWRNSPMLGGLSVLSFQRISKSMQDTWIEFVRGNKLNAYKVSWPTYNQRHRAVLIISEDVHVSEKWAKQGH